MGTLRWLLVLLVAGVPKLDAQGLEADAPGRVAAELLAAHAAQDWRQLHQRAHPAALKSFQAAQLGLVTREVNPRLRSAPDWTERQNRTRRTNQFLLDSIYRVGTASALRPLSADSVFVRYHATLERVVRAAPGFASASHSIVGEVRADSLAYVVVETRREREGAESEVTLGVTSFRRAPGGWLSMLDGPLAIKELVYHIAWHGDE